MKEEIWNELYLYLIRIEIGVFKNFKECARSPCNGNHFSSTLRTVIFTGIGKLLPDLVIHLRQYAIVYFEASVYSFSRTHFIMKG